MSGAELIKKFSDYVYYFKAYCTSDAEDHEMLKAVLALLKGQEQQIWELQEIEEYLTDKLKEQEPVKPISYYHGLDRPFTYRCGHCNHSLKDGDCFCSGCGRGIDWE